MAHLFLKDQLARKLQRLISSEVYPVGSLLPTELQLQATEGVSRQTVRGALAQLERLGLIERRPHNGTRVISRGAKIDFNQYLSSMSDLNRLSRLYPRKILDAREVVADHQLAQRIGCVSGEKFIRFAMIRVGRDHPELPIAWTLEYVNRDWTELLAEARNQSPLLMIELICSLYGYECAEIRQTIAAATISEEAALFLRSTPGQPCLRVTRRYIESKGEVILITDSYHPADRYAFHIDVVKPRLS